MDFLRDTVDRLFRIRQDNREIERMGKSLKSNNGNYSDIPDDFPIGNIRNTFLLNERENRLFRFQGAETVSSSASRVGCLGIVSDFESDST